MNALEEALKPLSSSGPPLLAALAKIVPEAAERDALAAAIFAALVEQASRAGAIDARVFFCFCLSFFFFVDGVAFFVSCCDERRQKNHAWPSTETVRKMTAKKEEKERLRNVSDIFD